jgi:hypothetical protein
VKRLIPLAVIGIAALAAFAATCTIQAEKLTLIGDSDTFAGELHNDSGVNILNHKIKVAFLNENGSVLETRTVNGCLRSLQDGAVNFFSVASSLDADDTDIALARMANLAEDTTFKVGEVEQGNLSFSGVVVTRSGDSLTVTGTLTNDDGDTLEDPAVCVVVYNDDGRVLIVGRDAGLEDLEPDENDTFSVTLTVVNDSDEVASVDLWADGLEDDTPIEPVGDLENDVTVSTPTPTGTPATATPVPTETPTP